MSEKTEVALVIGAGDATGGAIARRFAREGFTACVTRRTADKLAPLVASIESDWRKARAFGSDARKEEADDRARRYHRARDRPDRGSGLQHRRQCQVRHHRDYGARLRQGLGDGVLRRFPDGARGGEGHGAAWPGDVPFRRATAAAGTRLLRPSRVPSMVCARSPRAWRASWGRWASTWRTRRQSRNRHPVDPYQLSRPLCTDRIRAECIWPRGTSPRPTGMLHLAAAHAWTHELGPARPVDRDVVMGRQRREREINTRTRRIPVSISAARMRTSRTRSSLDRAAHQCDVRLRADPARRRIQADQQPPPMRRFTDIKTKRDYIRSRCDASSARHGLARLWG